MVQLQVHAHVGDHRDLFVQHGVRQAEGRDVGPHQPAGLAVLFEDRDLVAERHQVIGDGQRGATGADQGDAAAILDLGNLGKQARYIVPVVGGDALQPADGDGLLFDPAPAAGGLAGAVADPSQDPWEHIRVPVHHVGLGEAALSDQPDVLGNIGVGRAGPLAIHDSMVVVGMRGISWFHSMPRPGGAPETHNIVQGNRV